METTERVELYTDAYLDGDTASGHVERVVSRAVRVPRARVVIYGVVKQLKGSSNRMFLLLEGSNDGVYWFVIGSALQLGGPVNADSSTPVTTSAPWVRLRAYVLTTGSPLMQAYFDAGLVFSSP